MKEKRYFCDFWFGSEGHHLPITIFTLLGFLIILSISSFINYNLLISKYENELNSYSEDTYKYLDEIADDVIQEGVGIDELALPDDVVNYSITSENNEVIFNYYLDNNKDMKYAPSANMEIKLSNDFKILSKEPNCRSEKDYISNIKSNIILFSILYGFLVWIVFMALLFITFCIAAFISQKNKNKDLSEQEEDSDFI